MSFWSSFVCPKAPVLRLCVVILSCTRHVHMFARLGRRKACGWRCWYCQLQHLVTSYESLTCMQYTVSIHTDIPWQVLQDNLAGRLCVLAAPGASSPCFTAATRYWMKTAFATLRLQLSFLWKLQHSLSNLPCRSAVYYMYHAQLFPAAREVNREKSNTSPIPWLRVNGGSAHSRCSE